MNIFLVLGSLLKTRFSASKSTIIDGPDFTIASPRNPSILKLEIERNPKIKFLPIRVGEIFPNLDSYEVKKCSIEMIKQEHFADLHYLIDINLSSNEIEKIEGPAFYQLTHLEKIDLGNNRIKALPDFIFESNENLQKIFLRENKISVLSEKTFKNLLNLQVIDLKHNTLTNLRPEVFFKCVKLREILLMSNRLSNIKVDTFIAMKDLHVLDLRCNKCYNKCFVNSSNSVSDSFNEIAVSCSTSKSSECGNKVV